MLDRWRGEDREEGVAVFTLVLDPVLWAVLGLLTIFPNESFICFICTESFTFNAFNDSIIFAEFELNESFIFNVRDLDVPGRDSPNSPDPDTADPDLEVGVTLPSLPPPSPFTGLATVIEGELEEEVLVLPLLRESNPLILRPPSLGLAFATERAKADDFFERVENVLDALELFLDL